MPCSVIIVAADDRSPIQRPPKGETATDARVKPRDQGMEELFKAQTPRGRRWSSGDPSSLEKGLLILQEIASSEHPLTPAEISQAAGLNRSTTYRLCEVLESVGWLARMPGPDGQRGLPYDIGFAAHGLAVLISSKYDTTAKLQPVIDGLARTLEETVHVGVLEYDKVVHVARALPDEGPNMAARIGSRQYAHVTALGKAMLAALPQETVAALYVDERLPGVGPRAISTRAELSAHLRTVAEQGYALDDEESRPGVRCVAAPLFGPDGHPLLAVSVTTMAVRLQAERLTEVADATKAAATLATTAFGGRIPEWWGTGGRSSGAPA